MQVSAPGKATIRAKLSGTPGLRFQMVRAEQDRKQTVRGVVPGEVSFRADALTATIGGLGPGELGFEVYRDSLLVATVRTPPSYQ